MSNLHGQRGLLIRKVDEEKRLAFGWAYIAKDEKGNVLIDKQGDFVDDPEELEKAAYKFVRDARRAGDMHRRIEHPDGSSSPVQVGHMVESFVTTPDKVSKMGLDPSGVPIGWWVGFRVDDEGVWSKVMDGTYGGFSIHGKGRRHYV